MYLNQIKIAIDKIRNIFNEESLIRLRFLGLRFRCHIENQKSICILKKGHFLRKQNYFKNLDPCNLNKLNNIFFIVQIFNIKRLTYSSRAKIKNFHVLHFARMLCKFYY